MVEKGILKSLSSVLELEESRILAVALEGIENVLKAGKIHYQDMGKENRFAIILEQESGLEMIESLQMHPNYQIYEKSLRILESYF